MRQVIIVVAFMVALASSSISRGQMSFDDAMKKMQAAQAARAADHDSSGPPSSRPTTSTGDLSSQLRGIETILNRSFSGRISAQWTPAQTDKWLNKNAAAAGTAVPKLVGMELPASIVIDSTVPAQGLVVGHLLSLAQRLTLTFADRQQLFPLQQRFNRANGAVEQIQSQLTQLQDSRDVTQRDLRVAQQNYGSNAGNRISQDETTLGNLDSQISAFQSQLGPARTELDDASAQLKARENEFLAADKEKLKHWGPVTLGTSDIKLLSKGHGQIVTLKVRVLYVAVKVVRVPDGAGWQYLSQNGGDGDLQLPVRDDEQGSQAAQPYVDNWVSFVCADTESPPSMALAPPTLPSDVAPPSVAAAEKKPPPESPGSGAWWGSGFFISEDGLMLTNRHVARDAKTISVAVGVERFPATVVAIDDQFDLALLRVKSAGKVHFLQLSPNDSPSDGADSIVLGFPDPDELGMNIKITKGIVTSNTEDAGEGRDVVFDAKTNGGNSGGPIADKFGNVMAIVAAKTYSDRFQESYSIGISAGHVRKFLGKCHITLPVAQNTATPLATEDIVARAKLATGCIMVNFSD